MADGRSTAAARTWSGLRLVLQPAMPTLRSALLAASRSWSRGCFSWLFHVKQGWPTAQNRFRSRKRSGFAQQRSTVSLSSYRLVRLCGRQERLSSQPSRSARCPRIGLVPPGWFAGLVPPVGPPQGFVSPGFVPPGFPPEDALGLVSPRPRRPAPLFPRPPVRLSGNLELPRFT